VAIAGPAGIEESEMLHIQNTDSDAPTYAYAFVVIGKGQELDVGAFLDVSSAVGSHYIGALATQKLTGVRDAKLEKLHGQLNALFWRARFSQTPHLGVFLVKTRIPLTPDVLKVFLRGLPPEELVAFFGAARI
jgi:hypothetical protein